MPFIALDIQTNQRIDITKVIDPRTVLQKAFLRCQLCGSPLIIKAGMVKQAHFAHTAVCTTEYQFHPESGPHRDAKLFLVKHLSDEFHEYTSATFEYEVPIPEVKRVADILVSFATGWRIAHEVQLSSITTEELQQRTNDYEQAGIDVVWWLGNKANTPTNVRWCEEQFGYALTIYEDSRS